MQHPGNFLDAEDSPPQGKKQENHPKTESVHYDETAELLGKEGLAAIANTMAAFRKG